MRKAIIIIAFLTLPTMAMSYEGELYDLELQMTIQNQQMEMRQEQRNYDQERMIRKLQRRTDELEDDLNSRALRLLR